MKKNTVRYFYAFLLITSLSGCSKEMPKSLSEILKRNGIENSGSGGGNSEPGGGAPSVYQGQNADLVHQLLSRVTGWRTASCDNCNDFILPDVPINVNCQRDTYVAAAVSYAWAAESKYRLGEFSVASTLVASMMQNLQYAKALCGPGTINGGGSCLTLYIFPC